MTRRCAAVISGAAALCAPAPAHADSTSYRGEYVNAQVAGRTADGTAVAVMAGTHVRFPYDDPGSDYGQIAVQVGYADPVVVTGRPRLHTLAIRLDGPRARLSFAAPRAAFDLEFDVVRHTSRFEGDPAQIGDVFLGLGLEPQDSPGLVYTPYELERLTRGTLRIGARTLQLAELHGQAETGRLDAPTDARFRSAYDYLAAPTLDAARAYTYVAFRGRALHSGSELNDYFRQTASDEFTMERGELRDGNEHSAPVPFANTRGLPTGALVLGQWTVDLGPGSLYRKLVLLRDGGSGRLLALSETIEDDTGRSADTTAPVISAARIRRGRVSFTLSEPALVSVRDRRRWLPLRFAARAGANGLALRRPRGPLILCATDQAGNRARAVARR